MERIVIQLRVPGDLKSRIQEAAAAENRTMSNYILNAVIERMKKTEEDQK